MSQILGNTKSFLMIFGLKLRNPSITEPMFTLGNFFLFESKQMKDTNI
jgi:hypothetical protein